MFGGYDYGQIIDNFLKLLNLLIILNIFLIFNYFIHHRILVILFL